MIIDVVAICGEDIISRDAGRKVRDHVLSHWDEPSLDIVFSGRRIGSVSFFDEAIGLLIKQGRKTPEEIQSKIKFSDLRPEDRRLLNHVFATRIQEAKDGSRH